MELNWNKFNGLKVHLILKNNYEYNGIIQAVNDCGNGLIFLELLDKFGKIVVFATGEIKFIEVKE